MYIKDRQFVNIYIYTYVHTCIRKFRLLFLHYIKKKNLLICKLKIDHILLK